MELPPAVTWAREEQIRRDDFVGSEAEWQHHVEGEERRLAAWLKWIEHREALIEAMPAAYLYHIAEARGRRRETLLEAASTGKTVGCACGATKPGAVAIVAKITVVWYSIENLVAIRCIATVWRVWGFIGRVLCT